MSDSNEKTNTQKHNAKAAAKAKLEKKKKMRQSFNWRPHDNPEHEETIEGEVVDFAFVPTQNPQYDDMPILFIQEEDREVYTALPSYHTVLASQLGDIDVEMGDYIIVSYVGKVNPEDGDPYHEYVAAKPGEEEEQEVNVSEVFG